MTQAADHDSDGREAVPIGEGRRSEAIFALHEAINQYIAEAETDPLYCGISIDELRNDDGKLLAVRLVLADMIAGTLARRV